MKRQELCDTAKQYTTADRDKVYGSPLVSFSRIAERWSITVGRKLSPAEVAIMLVDMKLARLNNTSNHADSWVDVAGYAACGVEVATENE